MPEEKPTKRKHNITMEQRERIYITGVYDVLSFDDESITAETDYGLLLLSGNELHVTKLNLEDGELDVEGEIVSLHYREGGITKPKGSLFGKMFK